MVDVDYAGDRIVVERNDGNLEQRDYLHGSGMDEPLVWYEGAPYSTDRSYMYADERGSIIALADNAGNSTAINKYNEYGTPQGTITARFGNTGQAWLPQGGLFSYDAMSLTLPASEKPFRLGHLPPSRTSDCASMHGQMIGANRRSAPTA